MRIYNRCWHPVSLMTRDGKWVKFPLEGIAFRMRTDPYHIDTLTWDAPGGETYEFNVSAIRIVEAVQVVVQPDGKWVTFADGLPEFAEDIVYIVSSAVKKHYPERTDLYSPGHGTYDVSEDGEASRSGAIDLYGRFE